MARIAFINDKLGLTDGVSLEVDKWRAVFEAMGHEVWYIAGNERHGIRCIPELALKHPRTQRLQRNVSGSRRDYRDREEELADLDAVSAAIESHLLDLVRGGRVDLLIPHNLLSLGHHLPALVALAAVLVKTGLPTISHAHEFWFEEHLAPPCEDEAKALLTRLAPPPLPWVRHVVLNRLAQAELQRRCGATARVVPNVFDFRQPAWVRDGYNADLRTACGIGADDIVLLHTTSILERKGVELAIDLAAELGGGEARRRLESAPLHDGRHFGPGSRVVLLCTGYHERWGVHGGYVAALEQRARERGVVLCLAGDKVGHQRDVNLDGRKIYARADAYAWADAVVCPSLYEAWGNQVIETVFARLPLAVFEYPVWTSDLAGLGFEVVSLGGEISGRDDQGLAVLPAGAAAAAADALLPLLQDAKVRGEVVEDNFRIGERHLSFDRLSGIARELLAEVGIG